MNYTELYNNIQSYCENTFPATFLASGGTVDTTAQINTFITQAEARIYNAVQFPALRKLVTGSTTTNNPYLSCPVDFLASYTIGVIDSSGSYAGLLEKDPSFLREAYPNGAAVGTPKYYTVRGPQSGDVRELTFALAPTPDAVYQMDLAYFYYPESITTVVGGRTWLGDNFDPVLLYGSLVEAATFMKSDADTIAQYTKQFQDAIVLAKRLGDGIEKADDYRRDVSRMRL